MDKYKVVSLPTIPELLSVRSILDKSVLSIFIQLFSKKFFFCLNNLNIKFVDFFSSLNPSFSTGLSNAWSIAET